jgi:hypothetical protein
MNSTRFSPTSPRAGAPSATSAVSPGERMVTAAAWPRDPDVTNYQALAYSNLCRPIRLSRSALPQPPGIRPRPRWLVPAPDNRALAPPAPDPGKPVQVATIDSLQ